MNPKLKSFVNFARRWFEGVGRALMFALEFGSRSKNENTPCSDYDIIFYVYSPDKLYIPRYIYPEESWHDLNQNNYFKELQSEFPSCEMVWDDYISKLHSDWDGSGDLKIEGAKTPIDVRWLMGQLSHETKHSDFLEFICGDILYDTGICSYLRSLIHQKKIFHKDGILSIILSNARKSIESMTSTFYKRLWIHHALDAVVSISSVVSLSETGKPVWKINEVTKFVASNYPAHVRLVKQLYNLKRSATGRNVAKDYTADSVETAKNELLNYFYSVTNNLNIKFFTHKDYHSTNNTHFKDLKGNISNYILNNNSTS